MMDVKSIKKRILDFIFPQHLKCHCCDREANVNSYGICKECEEKLLFSADAGAIEGIDGYAAGLQYNETAKRAMWSFKYHGAVYKKEFLIKHIRIPEEWKFDCLVPVPLHIDRQRSRGYNQSTVLAKAIAERDGLIVREDLLERIRNTPQQANLNQKERLKNVKNAFRAKPECRGMSIVLVDDMRTTGATLRECAAALRKAGASAVYAVTACCSMEEVDNSE